MLRKKILIGSIIALAVLLLFLLVYIYSTVSPSESVLFPKCPTLMYLGFECPGCGSQRSIHHLLNFEILEAMKMNVLTLLAIPYLLIWSIFRLYFSFCTTPSSGVLRWRKRLFGATAIWVIFTLVVLFCIARNFTDLF